MIINKATQLFVQMHRRDDVRQTALKYSNTCNEVDMLLFFRDPLKSKPKGWGWI